MTVKKNTRGRLLFVDDEESIRPTLPPILEEKALTGYPALETALQALPPRLMTTWSSRLMSRRWLARFMAGGQIK